MNHLLEVAIKLLSERHHTEHELRQRLEKNFSNHPELDKVIESTINRLKELHLLNDHHTAETLAARYAHKGNRFISQVLHQKGISNEAIHQALQSVGDEYSRAMDEARRKMRGMNSESSEQKKTRLYRFLSGRSFSFDTIKQVCSTLIEQGLLDSSDESKETLEF